MGYTITNDVRGDEYVNSRDVIKRIDELESDRDSIKEDIIDKEEAFEAAQAALEAARDAIDEATAVDGDCPDDLITNLDAAQDAFDDAASDLSDAKQDLATWEEEYADELESYIDLRDQAEPYGDWSHGETLIREDKFAEYAEQLAEDTGSVNRGDAWPNNYIDWDAAAEHLKTDYTSVTFDGTEYLMRS